jgi:acyl-CoA thioester hydrolase
MPATNDPVYRFTFEVPASALDQNGHVNNVVYVQWMQDAAVRHFVSLGGADVLHRIGATWVVRSHTIEYLRPCFEGETVQASTWVESIGRVRSNRRYEFVRTSDDQVLARGGTEWVLIDASTGRPKPIPTEIRSLLDSACKGSGGLPEMSSSGVR